MVFKNVSSTTAKPYKEYYGNRLLSIYANSRLPLLDGDDNDTICTSWIGKQRYLTIICYCESSLLTTVLRSNVDNVNI